VFGKAIFDCHGRAVRDQPKKVSKFNSELKIINAETKRDIEATRDRFEIHRM
jgi:hypothetical protein